MSEILLNEQIKAFPGVLEFVDDDSNEWIRNVDGGSLVCVAKNLWIHPHDMHLVVLKGLRPK